MSEINSWQVIPDKFELISKFEHLIYTFPIWKAPHKLHWRLPSPNKLFRNKYSYQFHEWAPYHLKDLNDFLVPGWFVLSNFFAHPPFDPSAYSSMIQWTPPSLVQPSVWRITPLNPHSPLCGLDLIDWSSPLIQPMRPQACKNQICIKSWFYLKLVKKVLTSHEKSQNSMILWILSFSAVEIYSNWI